MDMDWFRDVDGLMDVNGLVMNVDWLRHVYGFRSWDSMMMSMSMAMSLIVTICSMCTMRNS